MPLYDLFSKRQKKLRGEIPEIYVYDIIPPALRVQIVHIMNDALGDESKYHAKNNCNLLYKELVKILCREYGTFQLVAHGSFDYDENAYKEFSKFLLKESDIEKALDGIELVARAIDIRTRNYDYLYRDDAEKRANSALEEINDRFREHGIGYQYESKKLIRIDSQFIHHEAVKPALKLLHQPLYAGAEAEFLKAHEHYREGNKKESLVECLKAFESVMKTICKKHKWPLNEDKDTANKLIQTCIENGLIPEFWLNHFSGLRATLESAIPTVRNKLGGHGQGEKISDVPEYIVAYTLHMTASSMIFLIEAEKKLN